MPDIVRLIQTISIYAVPVLVAITFHEAAHGYVAYKKGDPTAYMLGRVTLNPLKHIDPVGTVLLPLALLLMGSDILFGWAKPVPVNFRLLRDQKWDPIYVAAAGVVTNLGLAAIAGIVFRLLLISDPGLQYENVVDSTARFVTVPLLKMCVVFVVINVVLALFNMIPVPPLDGGRIAVGLLPARASMMLASVERYGILIVIMLWMFGLRDQISGLVGIISSFFLGI